MSYCNLSEALRQDVIDSVSPITPCRMIRLTATVYWNHLKRGVDVLSRYIKTVARCDTSENPVVSIVARLLSIQVRNAVVVYSSYQAYKSKLLPRLDEIVGQESRGHCHFTHKISQSETFGRFVRLLARDWVDMKEKTDYDSSGGKEKRGKLALVSENTYNVGSHKSCRLNHNIVHKKVSAQATYFALCTWALRGQKGGKDEIKGRAPNSPSGFSHAAKRYVLGAEMNGTRRPN